MSNNHTPLRRSADQTVEEMTKQLSEADERTHWKAADPDSRSKLSHIVNGGTMLIANPPPRVDLSNAEAVKARARHYWQACVESGRLPTFSGLAAVCGFSRKSLYSYLNGHSDETSRFLEVFQTCCADLLMQAGLTNSVNTIMSIFLLKNSGQGLADRSELEVTAVGPHSPLDDLPSVEEARMRYLQGIPELEEDMDDE